MKNTTSQVRDLADAELVALRTQLGREIPAKQSLLDAAKRELRARANRRKKAA